MKRAAIAAAVVALLLAFAWWRRSWVPTYATWREYADDEHLFV